jgi:Ca-activated chloride channel family protein
MKKLLLLLMLLSTTLINAAYANQIITGYVYDAADKQPLPGVVVKSEDPSKAVTTDIAGHFEIRLADKTTALAFIFIGYQTQVVKLTGNKPLQIYLQAATNNLNETVTLGYGKTQTQSVSKIKAYEITSMPSPVGGRVSGLQVTPNRQTTSVSQRYMIPASPSAIHIRGTNSITTGQQPLIIVDGITVNTISSINPNDIEKMDVLKDASATAIYGSKGANGVILIATKNRKFAKDKKAIAEAQKIIPPAAPFVTNPATPPFDESYQATVENKFQNPLHDPLSTFSVDVDAASYSNIRRYINNGQLPPKYAVRIEEMINYFDYNLPAPVNNEPVAIHTELSAAPWNPQHRLLRIGLKARVIANEKLPASNLVFLIDVSGSMNAANKLPLVQSSLKMLVDELRPQDKVAIVVYAGAAGLVLPPTPGNQKTTIKDAIDRLQAGGSTAGGAGIKLAYHIAQENFLKKGNNRVILATDGDFNVGASSDQDMEQLIEQERKSGVFLSVLGYGMGNYKDSKMETLADKGNGNYAYIDNATEARKTLVSEFGGTLFTVAKDVKLQLEFNPAKVAAYRLTGYENRLLNKEDFNNDLKDAGDMGAGHRVTALYEIIPAGTKDDFTNSVDPLKYQQPKQSTVVKPSSDEMLTIKFRYKEPAGSASKLSKAVIVDRPVAFDKTSTDFKWASAVAEVGMLLRDSEFKQSANFKHAISIARAAKGTDHEGYRAEFIKLAESAMLLSKSTTLALEGDREQ